MSVTIERTALAYAAAFERERLQAYPMVDAFERRMGYALDSERLLNAARVLACPIKSNAPNWQHGRIVYASTRRYVTDCYLSGKVTVEDGIWHSDVFNLLDIGTAKGFSALCMQWALRDVHCIGRITSVDIIDPASREKRNTLAEVDGYKTLAETLSPWEEASDINFVKSTGQKWLQEHTERVHVAFIDGKHSYEAVSWEVALLSQRQQAGDLAMFDDVQIAGVAKALKEQRAYELEYLEVLPNRKYAIGRRK